MYNVYYYPTADMPFKHISMKRSYSEEKREPEASDIKLDESLSRTRRLFFDYAMCNDFDLFVTFTFDPKKFDSKNYSDVQKPLSRFFMNFRNRVDPSFKYMLIPEQHESGAWHFHGLCTEMVGLCTPLKIPKEKNGKIVMVKNTKRYMSWPAVSEKFGYFSCSYMKSYSRTVGYIQKYITKSFGATYLKNRQLLLKSKNLRKPDLIYSSCEDVYLPDGAQLDFCTIAWRHEQDVGYRPIEPFVDSSFFDFPKYAEHTDCTQLTL